MWSVRRKSLGWEGGVKTGGWWSCQPGGSHSWYPRASERRLCIYACFAGIACFLPITCHSPLAPGYVAHSTASIFASRAPCATTTDDFNSSNHFFVQWAQLSLPINHFPYPSSLDKIFFNLCFPFLPILNNYLSDIQIPGVLICLKKFIFKF